MAFSRVTRIILYIVAGISVLVVLFFYVGPRTVDYDSVEQRVEEALNPPDITPAPAAAVADTTEQDTAVVDQDTVVAGAADEDLPLEEEATSVFGTSQVVDTEGTDLREVLSGYEYLVYYRTDIALIWGYILVLLTLLASIIFPLISVLSNPRALIRLVAVLVGAAVLVIISYLVSSDRPIDIIGYTGTDNRDPATLKMIDTVLFVTYMLFGLALASILFAIVSRPFK